MDNLELDIAINDILSKNDLLDLSDVGNEIGVTIYKYFSEELGWNKSDLLSGIEHGISLVDGTH